MFLNPIFSHLNFNCSNLLDSRNLQEQVEKAFFYQKFFWPFSVWINCSTNLKNFANYRPSASNFQSFSRSLEQFFSQWVRTILLTKYHFGFLTFWLLIKRYFEIPNTSKRIRWEVSKWNFKNILTQLHSGCLGYRWIWEHLAPISCHSIVHFWDATTPTTTLNIITSQI